MQGTNNLRLRLRIPALLIENAGRIVRLSGREEQQAALQRGKYVLPQYERLHVYTIRREGDGIQPTTGAGILILLANGHAQQFDFQ